MKLIPFHDLSALRAKYLEVIDRTPEATASALWVYGEHPSDDLLQAYIDGEEMYALMDQGEIAGMMAVTLYQEEDYHRIDWTADLEDDDVAAVHILAVCPDYAGEGIGRKLVSEAVTLARRKGKKAVRLDTLAANLRARHLYESAGFTLCGKADRFLENHGWITFLYYEHVL